MTAEALKERTYSEDEIKARLARDLPHWWLEGGWIRRKYRTNSWKGTLMVINTVGHLAEAAWHHPDITASYAWSRCALQNHAAKGITRQGFRVGQKDPKRSFIGNRPNPAERLKVHSQQDARFAYIKYDK